MVTISDAACTAAWGRTIDTAETFCATGVGAGHGHLPRRLGRAAARLHAAGRPRCSGIVSSARRLPRRDAARRTFARVTANRSRASWRSPSRSPSPVQVRRDVGPRPAVGRAAPSAATRASWDEPDAGPLQLRLVPRPRPVLLDADPRAAPADVADRGTQVTCVVIAENDAGANFGVAGFPTVAPGPPVVRRDAAADPPRPRARCSSAGCAVTRARHRPVRHPPRRGRRPLARRGVRLLTMTRRGQSFVG